ncbi:hypothetical protein JKF63_07847 [Porcisia hertigi]|uniref:Uncharacterized protein n=1 Tax=Porcisia hertigi TaxID=2761500 RepID=A0A836LMM8_9TRYP|nr:hypothetical protein JKF63_07847 [Porcisia hertigi]
MPGVDLLDAFAELVVRVVFSLPQTEPDMTPSSSSSSDDDDADDVAYGANSSSTQIFSNESLLEDEQQLVSTLSLAHHSNHSTPFGSGAPHSATPTAASCSHSISRGNSATSLDLYPGGIWNALARAPALGAVGGGRPSRPSSTVSLGTGDILSTPPSGTSLWNRIVGSGRTQTHVHGVCISPDYHTSYTTATSSFVQLEDEELGLGAAATGRDSDVGAAHSIDSISVVMGGGICATPITVNSSESTPVCDAYPSQSSPLLRSGHPQQQLVGHRDPLLTQKPLHSGSGSGSGSGNSECPSHHTRSSSEFDVL